MENNFKHRILIEITGDENKFYGEVVEPFDIIRDLSDIKKQMVCYVLLHVLEDYYTKFMDDNNEVEASDYLMGLLINGISSAVHSKIANNPLLKFSCSCSSDDIENFMRVDVSKNPFGLLN